jgi:hypothetical protein
MRYVIALLCLLTASLSAGFQDRIERPCATGVQNYSGYGANTSSYIGTRLGNTYRTFHYVVGDHQNLRFYWGGWVTAKDIGDQPAPNSYNLQAKAQILYPDGTTAYVKLRFGGELSATVDPGETQASDPLRGFFPDGTKIWIRQRPSVSVQGQVWPSQRGWHSGLGEGMIYGNNMDAATSLFKQRDYRFGPVLITGEPVSRLFATPAIYADSYEITGASPVQEYGPIRRCLSDNIAGIWMPGDEVRDTSFAEGLSQVAYVRLERPAQNFSQATGMHNVYRLPLAMKADYILIALGFNNLGDGGFPVLREGLLGMAQDYAGTGKTIVIRTIGMRTTSSDDVTSAGGQTPSPYEEGRAAYNEYVLDPNGAAAEVGAIVGGKVIVWDAFAGLEVNEFNQLQRGGGRWRIFGEHGPYVVAKNSTAKSIRLTSRSLIAMGHREPRGVGKGFALEKNQYMNLSGRIKYASGALMGQERTFRIGPNDIGPTLQLRADLPQIPAPGDQVWVVLTSAGTGDLEVIHPSEIGMREMLAKGREILLNIPGP